MLNWVAYETVAGGVSSTLCAHGMKKERADKIGASFYGFLILLFLIGGTVLVVDRVFAMVDRFRGDELTSVDNTVPVDTGSYAAVGDVIGSSAVVITQNSNNTIVNEYPEPTFNYTLQSSARNPQTSLFETSFQITQKTPYGIPPSPFIPRTRTGMFLECWEKPEEKVGVNAMSEGVRIDTYTYVCSSHGPITDDQKLFKFELKRE